MTKKEEGIDVKDLLYHFLSNWRVFVFSIVVCLAVACIYIYYAMPTYRVTASVMVRDEKRGGDYITELTVFEDINALAKSATDWVCIKVIWGIPVSESMICMDVRQLF